jgi:class 3 adenylate cyclase
MDPAAEREGGIVEKFDGDGVVDEVSVAAAEFLQPAARTASDPERLVGGSGGPGWV